MIRGLFLDILNLSIAASWLILAVMLARLLLRRAPKSVYCVLWLLVGIRLIMPFSVTSAFGLIPSGAAVSSGLLPESASDDGGYALDSGLSSAGYFDEEEVWAAGNDDGSAESVNKSVLYFGAASAVWLAGVGIMLLYLLFSWRRLAGRVRISIPLEYDGIKYYQCDAVDTPFLFGLFCPRIYAPPGLDGETLGYVLRHEAAHRRRRDYLIKPVGFMLLTVYWFNPLVWAAYLLLCRDIELACDERVIRELGETHKQDYSRALLTCSVNHRIIAACPFAFGEAGVKARVKNVLNYKKPGFWVIVAAVLACAVIAVCFMTQRKEDEAETAEAVDEVVSLSEWERAVVNADTLKVREEPSTQAAAIGLLPSGAEIVVVDVLDDWVKISFEGGEAYVMREYVTLITDDSQEEQEALAQAQDKTDEKSDAVKDERRKAYVTQWAEAFCSRDAETIVELSSDAIVDDMEESGLLVQGIDENNKRYASLGWSSPWPWGGGYRIISAADGAAVILYYAQTSDPHFTVWREELSYELSDGNFTVTARKLTYCDAICTAEEFYEAYPDGAIDGTPMDYYAYNGAGVALNDNAKNASYVYEGLDAPDTAAVKLLNLLDNPNKAAVAVTYTNEEQTEAVAEITFLEDGSTARVRMIKPYGDGSIWLPQTYEGE